MGQVAFHLFPIGRKHRCALPVGVFLVRLRVKLYYLFMQWRSVQKKKVPDSPGVYFFKKGATTLYIGKATSLRDRIRSYFNSDVSMTRGPLIVKMLDEATGVSWQKTDSVLEALILEATLIKKHQPLYNTREKSDKSFNFVVITDEAFPRVFTMRERELLELPHSSATTVKLNTWYGPFPHATQLREALQIIRKIFPYRGKTDAPLRDARRRASRLYQELGLAPSLSSDDTKAYAKTIRNLKLFFEGKKSQLIRALERDMKMYAKHKQFEKAGQVKRQLYALAHIQDVSLIKPTNRPTDTHTNTFRVEAYDVAHLSETNRVGVMTVVEDGEANRREYRTFTIKQVGGGDTGALAEILERRLGHPEWRLPRLIVVDGGKAQVNTAEKILTTAGIAIPVVAVTKDDRHRPEKLLGDKKAITVHERAILLANHEAHRFAIGVHRKKRSRL